LSIDLACERGGGISPGALPAAAAKPAWLSPPHNQVVHTF
jgi:hypothetical protein